MGLDHSGVYTCFGGGNICSFNAYHDRSCYMGGPSIFLNTTTTKYWQGKLGTIGDYVTNTIAGDHTMIVRIHDPKGNKDVFLMYNRQKWPNHQVEQRGDMVVVSQIHVFFPFFESDVLTSVDAHSNYRIKNFIPKEQQDDENNEDNEENGMDLVIVVCEKTIGLTPHYAHVIVYIDDCWKV